MSRLYIIKWHLNRRCPGLWSSCREKCICNSAHEGLKAGSNPVTQKHFQRHPNEMQLQQHFLPYVTSFFAGRICFCQANLVSSNAFIQFKLSQWSAIIWATNVSSRIYEAMQKGHTFLQTCALMSWPSNWSICKWSGSSETKMVFLWFFKRLDRNEKNCDEKHVSTSLFQQFNR